MRGSERQIKWAEDIKAQALDTIRSMRETRKHYDDLDGKPNSNLYDITYEAIDAIEAELMLGFDRIEDASVIIDNRDRLTADAIRNQARKWMRYNVRG